MLERSPRAMRSPPSTADARGLHESFGAAECGHPAYVAAARGLRLPLGMQLSESSLPRMRVLGCRDACPVRWHGLLVTPRQFSRQLQASRTQKSAPPKEHVSWMDAR